MNDNTNYIFSQDLIDYMFRYSKYPNKEGQLIDWGWHKHKDAFDEHTKLLSKMEHFRYFKGGKLKKLIKFLNTKSFNFSKNYPKWFNFQIANVWKIVNSQWKESHRWEHEFYIHFCKAIEHRGQSMLARVYECITNDLQQIKLEITFQEFTRIEANKKIRWLKWERLKKKDRAIKEVQRKFNKRFPWWEEEQFLDFSHYSKK